MGNFLGCTGDDAEHSPTTSRARRRACRNLNTAVNKLGVRPTEKTVRDAEKAAENLLNAMMKEQDAAEASLLDQLREVDETQAVIEDAMATLNDVDPDEMEEALRELQEEVDREQAAELMRQLPDAPTGKGSRRTRKHKKRKRKTRRRRRHRRRLTRGRRKKRATKARRRRR